MISRVLRSYFTSRSRHSLPPRFPHVPSFIIRSIAMTSGSSPHFTRSRRIANIITIALHQKKTRMQSSHTFLLPYVNENSSAKKLEMETKLPLTSLQLVSCGVLGNGCFAQACLEWE